MPPNSMPSFDPGNISYVRAFSHRSAGLREAVMTTRIVLRTPEVLERRALHRNCIQVSAIALLSAHWSSSQIAERRCYAGTGPILGEALVRSVLRWRSASRPPSITSYVMLKRAQRRRILQPSRRAPSPVSGTGAHHDGLRPSFTTAGRFARILLWTAPKTSGVDGSMESPVRDD
ncbi:hypothetical protein K466DRAFT_288569 [Polyporus arcularius HHB13444]|uniref:Uncharacterized protein n=1 Tax=Polyporus arcularius HHB13444 TaxID=1314778 RepID=A0A5C3PA84_9APHY|nr:hypothetical protein K466DRAFT_288569 [Polyporus arcularius HHB13444]